jgi:hypothetical protein
LTVLLLLSPLLASCENWPLYLHLPVDAWIPPTPEDLSMAEDPTRNGENPIDAGTLRLPSHLAATGAIDACGFDAAEDGPAWPDHALDADGDGVSEGTGPRYSGWYLEDVDAWRFVADGPGWVSAQLSWENAPASGQNAPYRPNEPAGAWATETDLDVLVAVVVDGVTTLVEDAGFSASHPETTPTWVPIEDGETYEVLVACHHGLGSAYALDLRLDRP